MSLPTRYVERIDAMEREQLFRATGVLVFSSWVKESCVKYYGLPPERVEVVGYAANLPYVPDFLKRDLERRYLLFVCTDFHAKGGETILKAFELVREWDPKVELLIVGSVPAIVAGQLKKGIRVVGFRDKSDRIQLAELLQIYQKASILLLASTYDPMPAVVLEAMFLKTPVVAAGVCGIPEQVEEGKTGFLVPSSDVKSLANRIVALLANDQMRWAMGEQGRRRVEKLFTWDRVVDRSIRFIDHSLSKYGKRD
jgi:glycosyltransferase involved in cell wall biosynthesis